MAISDTVSRSTSNGQVANPTEYGRNVLRDPLLNRGTDSDPSLGYIRAEASSAKILAGGFQLTGPHLDRENRFDLDQR